jgi:8-oxo-dGTP diphosphatase
MQTGDLMTMTGNERPKVGIGVIVVREGKVLLGKRKSSLGQGLWSILGGHLEFGETPESCAIRELEEEAGLKALSLRVAGWTNDFIDDTKHYITLNFFVDEFEGEPKLLEPDKCEGWQWFSWDALPTPLFPSVHALVQKFGIEKLKYMTQSPKTSYQKNSHLESEASLHFLLTRLLTFYDERNWQQFHSPKNLVMDLASETGELVEIFRSLSEAESSILSEKTISDVRSEIGDIFKILLYLSHKLGIDPISATEDTIEKMRIKYPKELSYGKALKYTAYESKEKP